MIKYMACAALWELCVIVSAKLIELPNANLNLMGYFGIFCAIVIPVIYITYPGDNK